MGNHLFDRIVSPGRASAPFLLGPNGDLAWSYGTLRERVARIAGALVASGVRPGDRVAARIAKSPEGLMLYLGVVAAGAAFLPLNTGYALPELAFFLGDAQPALIVCDPAEAGEIGDLGVPVLTLGADGRGSFAEAADAAASVEPVTRDAADLAAILYTSGTTGRSKGAMITHGNLVSNAEALVAIWRFTEADRLVALRDALGGRLARYKLPKRVVVVDELPRNSMGKVQKAVLRERFRDIFEEGLPCAS